MVLYTQLSMHQRQQWESVSCVLYDKIHTPVYVIMITLSTRCEQKSRLRDAVIESYSLRAEQMQVLSHYIDKRPSNAAVG